MLIIRSLLAVMLLGISAVLAGCGADQAVEGLYVATTADNLNIKMRRYRPSPQHEYRTGTPVLLFPSIVLNLNEFDVHTPPWLNSYHYKLPADAPAWAMNDPVIQQDNLKYHSLSHYLYLRGYDVWTANYRGVGRGHFASDHGTFNTNLDVWCALDYPAAVDKVRSVTGKKPVIGGHSTGGLCAYLYLQGITMDAAILAQGQYVPHITSSPVLAAQRNSKVAGFLGLDPAGTPILAYEWLIDSPLVFDALALEVLMDLDAIMPAVLSVLPPVIVSGAIDGIWGIIGNLADAFPAYLPHWADLFGALNFWSTGNTNMYVEDYTARLGVSSFYIGGFAQYADWGINGVFREHWQNGEENAHRVVPPDRTEGDGYYYYQDNMARMTVPAFSTFSEANALVSTDTMVISLFEGKTWHAKDAWIEVPNTGHVDIVYGDSAPTISFPAIADWLDSL